MKPRMVGDNVVCECGGLMIEQSGFRVDADGFDAARRRRLRIVWWRCPNGHYTEPSYVRGRHE